ncbi:MAG: ORF6N domain-containing protein, partial [Candidatus Omnitrophota bacterium]|nr:ORF6N domain-containing protein [Candidatus Omnitrophota bacterium]
IQDYLCTGNMGYFQRLNNKSRMSREAHVRFCESIEGKFLFATRLMFQLTKTEKNGLVAICDRFNTMKHSTVLPYVFTEQGVAMLSGVLNSNRAIMVNIQIMRAFTQLRRMLLTNKDLKRKIEEMESKYDKQFAIVFQAIK